MNIFKSLLFLEGYITDPSILGDEFGPSYGNKVASGRSFRDAFTQPAYARPEADDALCSASGCG